MFLSLLDSYGFVKPKSRFNLLLLEPSEQYLNDCACSYTSSVPRTGLGPGD